MPELNVKNAVFTSLGFIVFGLLLNFSPITTVSQGTVKVGSLFGEVQPKVYSEGLHLVNPLLSFNTYDVKENAYELHSVSIPSQDKFKSDANITVIWSVDPSVAPTLRNTIGRMPDVENKILRQPLLSLLREAGRGVTKAQDLFNAETQTQLQMFITDGMRKHTEEYGVFIHNVFLQDIELPPVIMDAIITTKKLEEKEAQEQANLNREALIYDRQVKEAESKAAAAEQNKFSRQHAADARFYEQQQDANASLYSAQQQAKGNRALSSSITPNLLKLRNLEIALKQAENWKGGVPQTVMGDTAALPLFHMNQQ